MKVSVTWDVPEKLSILVAKVKEVEYPLTGECVDDSKNILQELGIGEDEDDDNDVGFQTETADNEDIQMFVLFSCNKAKGRIKAIQKTFP